MTTRKYASRSQKTTLSGALTSSSTSATVVSATTLLGGVSISAGQTFTAVIDPDTALEEIVDITAVSTNTLTITRGVESGGTGVAHSAGAEVRHMMIGRDLREANEHINSGVGSSISTTAHGVDFSTIVTTADSGTVTSAMIANGTIVNADINSSAAIDKTKISGTAITAADTATVTSGMIATGAVGTAKIDDAAVTEVKIGTAAVTATKIASDAVTTAKIQDGAVTSAKIADGTIVNADINASAAIDATKISGTAVTQADTGTVTSTMIANGTIVNADINSSAGIAYSKLSLGGTITSADLVDGTIVATDIADGTITAAKMVSDPYARANHTGTQASSTISDLATTVKAYRLDEFATPNTDVSMASHKITNVTDPTSAQDASTKAYVDAQVNALVNGAPGTLDTLGEIATALSSGGSVISTVVLKAGDTMTGPLTLSGAPSNNLHAATKAYVDAVAGSATAAAASAADAAATYDNFDDRYLGAKSTAPTLDNDGNALLTGAIYWNSVTNAMYAWTGTEWGSISSTAAIFRYRFNATGGETSVSGTDANGVTLSYIPGKEQVYLNGILLVRTTDYSATNGTSITSLSALASGDVLEIITFTSFELATAIDKTILDAKGDLIVGVSADTPGKLTAGSDGTVLVADSSTATGLKWSAYDPLPSQTGNSGKVLTTDGSSTSWAAGLPTQTGNSGKYLTTDGTSASWASVTTDPTPTTFLLMGA